MGGRWASILLAVLMEATGLVIHADTPINEASKWIQARAPLLRTMSQNQRRAYEFECRMQQRLIEFYPRASAVGLILDRDVPSSRDLIEKTNYRNGSMSRDEMTKHENRKISAFETMVSPVLAVERIKNLKDQETATPESFRYVIVEGHQLRVRGGQVDQSEIANSSGYLSAEQQNRIAAKAQLARQFTDESFEFVEKVTTRRIDLADPKKAVIRDGFGRPVETFERVGANGEPRHLKPEDYRFFEENR